MFPPSNLYITLDRDVFVDTSKKDPVVYTNGLLSSQGQWIVNITEDKYMGIVTEGPFLLTLDEWKIRYQKTVTDELEKDKSKEFSSDSILSLMRTILNLKIKKCGIQVSFYKFSQLGESIDISKQQDCVSKFI